MDKNRSAPNQVVAKASPHIPVTVCCWASCFPMYSVQHFEGADVHSKFKKHVATRVTQGNQTSLLPVHRSVQFIKSALRASCGIELYTGVYLCLIVQDQEGKSVECFQGCDFCRVPMVWDTKACSKARQSASSEWKTALLFVLKFGFVVGRGPSFV